MTHSLHDISWRTPGKFDSDKIFTAEDLKKVQKIKGIENKSKKTEALGKLLEFFSRGKIVPSADVPCNVVTIGSKILMHHKHDDATLELTVATTKNGDNQISVLSPLGLATLGLGVSDNIEFYSQKGIQFLTIDKILYQPQAFGAVA